MCIYEECKVVTWGDPGDGGDSGAVADMLASGVTPICSCARAFAAVKDRGGVVTWGDPRFGGDSGAPSVPPALPSLPSFPREAEHR